MTTSYLLLIDRFILFQYYRYDYHYYYDDYVLLRRHEGLSHAGYGRQTVVSNNIT